MNIVAVGSTTVRGRSPICTRSIGVLPIGTDVIADGHTLVIR